jgi:hypothetical protein
MAGSPVVYAWQLLPNVVRVREEFGNQTIIDPIKLTEIDRIAGFSGGNVAITVTGFLKGRRKRVEKFLMEFVRNAQALMAHIPGQAQGVGAGQIVLYAFLSVFGTFISDMCLQTHMAIKTMEFEHSAEIEDTYTYQIVFEKLSWGIFQYVIDLIVSGASIVTLANSSPSVISGFSLENFALEGVGRNVNVGASVQEDVIQSIYDSVENSEEIGQEWTVISDPDQDFPNLPRNYHSDTRIDTSLDWRNLPFLSNFPQAFTFNLGGDSYRTEWKVLDEIDENDVVTYHLHLTLSKNGTVVYIGKIAEKIEFRFDEISFFIRTFEISKSTDGILIHNISGMVALVG